MFVGKILQLLHQIYTFDIMSVWSLWPKGLDTDWEKWATRRKNIKAVAERKPVNVGISFIPKKNIT